MERSGRAPQDPSVCSGQTATPHWKKINPIIPQTHIPLPFSSLPCVPHLCFIHKHTQNLYKMLLLGFSLLSLHSSPYLMRSFLKAMWLTLWSECVFLNAVCIEPEFFVFSCSFWLSLANIYTTVLCTKVEFKYILSWTQNFCFLRSCFDVYSLVLNETHANLLFGVTIGPWGYTCCHGDLQPAKKRG